MNGNKIWPAHQWQLKTWYLMYHNWFSYQHLTVNNQIVLSNGRMLLHLLIHVVFSLIHNQNQCKYLLSENLHNCIKNTGWGLKFPDTKQISTAWHGIKTISWRVLSSGLSPFSVFTANQHFWGAHHLYLQGQQTRQGGNHYEAGGKLEHAPPKCNFIFNRLHSITSQKKELFKTTAVKTSNPTNYFIF
jgi:hypothetical protein